MQTERRQVCEWSSFWGTGMSSPSARSWHLSQQYGLRGCCTPYPCAQNWHLSQRSEPGHRLRRKVEGLGFQEAPCRRRLPELSTFRGCSPIALQAKRYERSSLWETGMSSPSAQTWHLSAGVKQRVILGWLRPDQKDSLERSKISVLH